jgi:hypothetical protein
MKIFALALISLIPHFVLAAGVCDRSPAIREEIRQRASRFDCKDVTSADLAKIETLQISLSIRPIISVTDVVSFRMTLLECHRFEIIKFLASAKIPFFRKLISAAFRA